MGTGLPGWAVALDSSLSQGKASFTAPWTVSQLRTLQSSPLTINEPVNENGLFYSGQLDPESEGCKELKRFHKTKNTFAWFRISLPCLFACTTFCPNFRYTTSSAFLFLHCVPFKALVFWELLKILCVTDVACFPPEVSLNPPITNGMTATFTWIIRNMQQELLNLSEAWNNKHRIIAPKHLESAPEVALAMFWYLAGG